MSEEPTATYVFANGNDDANGTPGPSIERNGNDPRSNKQGVILEQDRFMPIANISRIMKAALPPQAKLSKESKECVQECVTEFLLFLTSEASEKCHTERRKTITGEDLIYAMEHLAFDKYLPAIKTFHKIYKDANKIDRQSIEDGPQSPKSDDASYNGNGSMPASVASASAPIPQQQIQQAYMVQQVPQQAMQQHIDADVPPPQLEPANGQNHAVVAVPVESMPAPDPITIGGINGLLRRVEDVWVDPATSQHYIVAHSADGTSGLIPIEIRAVTQSGQQAPTPMSIEAVAEQLNMRRMH